MPGSLSPISGKPTGKTDVRCYWKWLAQLIDLYNALCNFQVVTNSGKNAFTITAGNAVLELNITATAAAASTPPPFNMTLTEVGGQEKISFWPGVVNQLVPANILDLLDVPAGANSYVCVYALTNGSQVTSCTLQLLNACPAPVSPVQNAAPASFYVVIGLIGYTAGTGGSPGTYTAYRVFPPGNVVAQPVEFLRTSAVNPTPGTLTYDTWYGWQIATDVTLDGVNAG